MSNLNFDSNIVVKDRNYVVRELVEQFMKLSGDEIHEFFTKIGLTVPKRLRIAVLRRTLEDAVAKTREERANLADELGYRLSWFYRFSEYQLENLLKFYKSPSLNRQYLAVLWVALLDYMMEKRVHERDIEDLIEVARRIEVKPVEDILDFNLKLKDVFYDNKGEIDGLTPDNFRPVLYKSSTLVELRELGKKYDVNVPRRLKKQQLADIICKELEDRGELNDELKAKINSMSIVIMQRFAKDHNVKASIELKKEEIIEYILANATQTKEIYYLPSDRSIYEKEVEEVHDEADLVVADVVEVKEEPQVEEPVEVKEEPQVEEPTPVVMSEKVIYEQVGNDELLAEVKALRQELQAYMAREGAPKELPTEHPGEAILVNTVNIKTDLNRAKKHLKKTKESYKNSELVDAEMISSQENQVSEGEKFVTVLTWLIALTLLGIVIFILINYINGGIF